MTAIFFDLDGTLTDPKEGITKSIQYALRELDVKSPSSNDLEWCIGPPLIESFDYLLGKPSLSEEALKLYRQRFAEKGLYENIIYPDVKSLLERLIEKDISLYVATSKPEVYAVQIIEHFGLERFFKRIFGSGLDGTRSNKADLLDYAISETGQKPECSFMVGDRKHDAWGALRNGMLFVGVTYGYGSREELIEAGARNLITKPLDLFGIVAPM